MAILGIDIGGTGIKGAPVDVEMGVLLEDRVRILTPDPATPEAMTDIVAQITAKFEWKGEIGVGYPGVIKHGHTMTAANLDPSWIGINARDLIAMKTGCPVTMVNDADAAGIAEMEFGAGRDNPNTVIVVTLGTGIGTAIFIHGLLLPNTELGHIEVRGKDAESRASERVRVKKGLSWREWGERLQEYFTTMENLFWPDLFIVGGGASKEFAKFSPYLTLRTQIVPAQLFNEAGIVGAALARKEPTFRL